MGTLGQAYLSACYHTVFQEIRPQGIHIGFGLPWPGRGLSWQGCERGNTAMAPLIAMIYPILSSECGRCGGGNDAFVGHEACDLGRMSVLGFCFLIV